VLQGRYQLVEEYGDAMLGFARHRPGQGARGDLAPAAIDELGAVTREEDMQHAFSHHTPKGADARDDVAAHRALHRIVAAIALRWTGDEEPASFRFPEKHHEQQQ
jgi:hypothetical protein